jgi:recombination protein RecT
MANEMVTFQKKALEFKNKIMVDSIRKAVAEAAPKWFSADRLLRVVYSSALKNPELMNCSIDSFLVSVMQCAQLGLEPILGRAYLIPYKNECTFQAGYQGLIDLARRSGEVKDVFAMVVYEQDDFKIQYGLKKDLVHVPCFKENPGPAIGAYTVWELKDGLKSFEFMPIHEIYKRRDVSPAYRWAKNPKNPNPNQSVWDLWPEEMIKKTVIKHFAKLMPSSIEIMEAVRIETDTETGQKSPSLFSFDDTLPLIEPNIDQKFQEGVADRYKVSMDDLQLYLDDCADKFQTTVENIKTDAMKNPGGFYNSFVTWWRLAHPQPEPEKPITPKRGRPIKKEPEPNIPNWTIPVQWIADLKEMEVYAHLLDRLAKYPEWIQDDIDQLLQAIGKASPDEISKAVSTDEAFANLVKEN